MFSFLFYLSINIIMEKWNFKDTKIQGIQRYKATSSCLILFHSKSTLLSIFSVIYCLIRHLGISLHGQVILSYWCPIIAFVAVWMCVYVYKIFGKLGLLLKNLFIYVYCITTEVVRQLEMNVLSIWLFPLPGTHQA
jgi:hypothetical protein